MNSVNFYRTYQLSEIYEDVKRQCEGLLSKYLEYPDLYKFNNKEKSLIFKSERLIPSKSTSRPKVILLFSNPHPHSVHQGMFLSPNTRGRENPFWETMRNTEWINFREEALNPLQIANLCFNVEYEGPFDFVFYPYYAFPTRYPKEIKKIFGREYFKQVIEPEARDKLKRTIRETEVNAVVTFNKSIFNLVSEDHVDRYIESLINGELIESQIKVIEEEIPIFLTFPTGWRYHKEIRNLRLNHLKKIEKVISNEFE
ncbi:MAG: hypothetical protein U9R53_09635 [Chloroflexota bacterium]|nr:hypothetical protein [Chloroflexota bacterium]